MGGTKGKRVALAMGSHVFKRSGPTWLKSGNKSIRGKIERVDGLTISQAMTSNAISKAIINHSHERMIINLKRQLDRYTRPRQAAR